MVLRWALLGAVAVSLGLWSGCVSGVEGGGGGCVRNSDCPEGQVCSADGVCAEQACQTDFDCPVGMACIEQYCTSLAENNVNNADNNVNNADNNVNNADNNVNNADNNANNNVEPDAEPDVEPDVEPDAEPDVEEDVPDEDVVVEPECAGDEECPAAEHCSGEVCVPGCHLNAGCGEGEECDVARHECVPERCDADGDCPEGWTCDLVSGGCEPPRVSCAGVLCGVGQWCDEFGPGCVDALPEARCAVASDCGAGTSCVPATEADGDVVWVCRPDEGEVEAGGACADDADCAAGWCALGTCLSPCAQDTDCEGPGAACVEVSLSPNDAGTPNDAGDDPSYDLNTCISVETCEGDADCLDDEACGLRPINGELLPVCIPALGDAGPGAPCDQDADCSAGVCGTGPFGIRLCFAPCAGDEACAQDSATCQEISIRFQGGETPDDPSDDRSAMQRVCFWSEGSQTDCTSGAQCPQGELCTLEEQDDQGNLTNACRPAWGEVGPGGACEVSNDCQSGLCAGGRCYGPCGPGVVCEAGTTCQESPQQEGLSLCAEPLVLCNDPTDCAQGRLCLPVLADAPNTLQGACVPPENEGGLGVGQACTADAQCASGTCLNGGEGPGVCYEICDAATNTGCPGGTRCYPNQLRFTFDQGTPSTLDDVYDSTAACVEDFGSFQTCTDNGVCPGAEICLPFTNQRNNAWELRCVVPVNLGGFERGEDCLVDADCASGFCAEFGVGLSACFTICNNGLDCYGLGTCERYIFTIDDRGTANQADDVTGPLSICEP
jgi:hypothetical protein